MALGLILAGAFLVAIGSPDQDWIRGISGAGLAAIGCIVSWGAG